MLIDCIQSEKEKEKAAMSIDFLDLSICTTGMQLIDATINKLRDFYCFLLCLIIRIVV